jgi:ribosome-binding protein aMBF1 (putative translation factor)
MTTTIVCPHCNTIVNVEAADVARCEKCGTTTETLYTYYADSKAMTLCLKCIQSGQWVAGATAGKKVGPSEHKSAN